MDQARSEVSQPRPNLPLHRLATPSTTRNANPPRNHPPPPPQFKTRPPKSSAQKISCTQRYRRKIVALARKKRASIAPSHQSWSYSPFSAYQIEEGMLLMQYSRVCKLIQCLVCFSLCVIFCIYRRFLALVLDGWTLCLFFGVWGRHEFTIQFTTNVYFLAPSSSSLSHLPLF